MCGIAGLVLAPPSPVTSEQVRCLSEHLEHRGPDDSGWLALRKGKVCLGREITGDFVADAVLVHRRLSILDLSEAGWQPMGTPDGRYWIVFNGEIYNYLELRVELEALGHRFRSRSDTEVLLTAYAEWSSEILNRLVGMFAFVILDVQTRKLFLARDFFGIKPLYYTYWRDGFAFASEIKPLLELPGVSRHANVQRLYDYLCHGITDHGGETLFADIRQFLAAHYMEVSLDNPHVAQPARYWQIDLNHKVELSYDEAVDRVRDLFLESIRLHLRSDVPVGAALSGGIDSSSIVMAMRHVNPNLNIHTFSYIADDPTISEEQWVDIASRGANGVAHKVRPHPEELVADLNHLVSVQGECFMSTSIYAQSRIFGQASEAGIKVMLDGQGADEMLAGYPTYLVSRLRSFVCQGEWDQAIRFLCNASRLPHVGTLWLQPRILALFLPQNLQAILRQWFRKDDSLSWLNYNWFRDHGVNLRNFSYRNGREALREHLYQTLVETSLPSLLRYEDRNSMAFSIESRVPFLTPTLANFLFSLPEEYFIAPDGTSKAVFRKAMRGIVPDAILNRKDKIGFQTPEKDWLFRLRAWVERVLTSQDAMGILAINFKELKHEWNRIVQGYQPFDPQVWRLLNMILWVQKFAVKVE
jgi:asparagine synthase (glutamine-hydrolysing)